MYDKLKRILAFTGAILLICLYLVTLVFAFIDPTAAKNWLMASVACTVIVPVLLYAYILIYRYLKKK